jgi:hypothetical protein
LPDWLPEPDQAGFGRYLLVDEWGNKLPSYSYRLVGQSGEVFQGRTEPNGRTALLPVSAHPLSKAEFPDKAW